MSRVLKAMGAENESDRRFHGDEYWKCFFLFFILTSWVGCVLLLSCVKAMFPQAFVYNSVNGGGCAWWGVYTAGGVHGGEGKACVWLGHVWWEGGAYVEGGMHGMGVCMAGGACMVGGVHGRRGVHGGGVHGRRGVHGGGVHGRRGMHGGGCAWQEGRAWWGCAWQEGHAWWGVCMAGGVCGRLGGAWQGMCVVRDTVNEWAVLILLECILVYLQIAFCVHTCL